MFIRPKPLFQILAACGLVVLVYLIHSQNRINNNVADVYKGDTRILKYDANYIPKTPSEPRSPTTLFEPLLLEPQIVKKTPGEYVHRLHPRPSNHSYCNFRYNLPYDLNYTKNDIFNGPELKSKSMYKIIYNVIQAVPSEGIPRVTYATHVTADFVNYLPELLRYWDGPISIAAFTPDLDAAFVLEQINQYCYCIPGMSRVSLHLVYPKTLTPSRKDIYFDRPDNCIVQDSSEIKTYRDFDDTIIYPVNVCRNVAREGAPTKFSLVSDAQLMPSKGLANKFTKMINATYNGKVKNRTVFVVPVFEVEETEDIPTNKSQLVKLLSEGNAVYFHQLVCPHCQKIPSIEYWNKTDPGDTVKPFVTVKREKPYHRWEPIFIGTRNEPYYNEGLSWEGLQDKMPPLLQMCLLGYDFTILDGAFLVHWPGIKKEKEVSEEWRAPFVRSNMELYHKIIDVMKKLYAPVNQKCVIDATAKLPGGSLQSS